MGYVDLGPKTFKAGAAIGAHKIVQFGADDDHVILADADAAAFTDLLGISSDIDADAAEDPVDVHLQGQVLVTFGGTVARGAAVKSDASGDAIAAATGNHYIGFAMQAAAAGDIGYIMIARGQLN